MENNIKMELNEKMEVDCIHLTQDRHKWQASMNMVMIFQVP